MKAYQVVDNILARPEFYVEWARTLEYDYTSECRIPDINRRDLKTDVGWRGYRSDEIAELNVAIATSLTGQLYRRCLSSWIASPYNQRNYLHYSSSEIEYGDFWWHQDRSNLAGVIYLTPDPEPESGTLLKINNKIVQIDNVFNRLVLYDASLVHRPERCFGNTINTARLTMTIFVDQGAKGIM
jgi:hypothetical protein